MGNETLIPTTNIF